jgi:DNA-binding GntR family transcriptional regulator
MRTDQDVAQDSLVERVPLSEQVHDKLLERIVAGQLTPGSRIVETRVAREFGVSQAPVREALRSLASLGLVEMRPHRGARVRQPSRDELVEAVHVRGVLEAYAAEIAAEMISADDLGTLERLVEGMRELARNGDALHQAHKNAEFHATVVRASGNGTLRRSWKLLEPFTQTYLTSTAPGVDLVWLADRHVDILDALRARDPEAASRATRKHFQQAAEVKGRMAPSTGSDEDAT